MSINVFSFDREEEVSSRKAGAFDVMIFFAIGDREKDVIADDTYYLKEKALLCQSIFQMQSMGKGR